MDHATTVNVAVTDDATKHDDELQALMPEGADLVLHEAEYTEAELDALHEEIFASKPLFASLSIELYSTFTIVQDNVVEIVVSDTSPEIEATIQAAFPPGAITVRAGSPAIGDACSRTNCGPPWRGGLKIYRGANGCTAGYVAKKYVGVWTYQLWTAGHCGSGTWHMGSASGPTIGSTTMNFFASSSIDVQGIGISSSAVDDDYLYGSAGCTSCVQTDIKDDEPSGGDMIGAMIRNNGAFSGSKGGILSATNGTIDYLGEHLTNLRRASYARKPGDSGGPVIRAEFAQYGSYNIAAGAHTHFQVIGGTEYALYTHISKYSSQTGYALHVSGD